MHRRLQPFTRLLHLRNNSTNITIAKPPFTITYTTPDNRIPVTESFKDIDQFHQCFEGWGFMNTKTRIIRYSGNIRYDIDPAVVYHAAHPVLPSPDWIEKLPHEVDLSDKAFEEKSIKCLERHLLLHAAIKRRVAQDPTKENGWRCLTAGTDVAEWEGIWVGPDGRVYFLETEYFVDKNTLARTHSKFRKSLKSLSLPPSMVAVYIAAKYWEPDNGRRLPLVLGFGTIEENGVDLEIQDPIPEPGIEDGAAKGVGGDNRGVIVGKRKGTKKGKVDRIM